MYESGKLSAPVTVIIRMLRLYNTDARNLLGVNAPEKELTECEKLYKAIRYDVLEQIKRMEKTRVNAGREKYSEEERSRLYRELFDDLVERMIDEDFKKEVIIMDSSAT